MGTDRRKYPRIDVRYAVRYKAEGSEGNGYRVVFLRNISRGGILFTTEEELKINSTIKMEIDLPRRSRVPITGKVVRCQEVQKPGKIKLYKVALKFTRFRIYRETLNYIDKIVKEIINSALPANLH